MSVVLVDVIFMDFRKPLTLLTIISFRELHKICIFDPLFSWLKPYISNRLQFINVHNFTSILKNVLFDVLRGGNLSPLLFILFVNTINYHNYYKYEMLTDNNHINILYVPTIFTNIHCYYHLCIIWVNIHYS